MKKRNIKASTIQFLEFSDVSFQKFLFFSTHKHMISTKRGPTNRTTTFLMACDVQENNIFGIILKGVSYLYYQHFDITFHPISLQLKWLTGMLFKNKEKNIKFIVEAIKIYFGFNDIINDNAYLFLKMILIYFLWHLCSKRGHLTKRRLCQYFIDTM